MADDKHDIALETTGKNVTDLDKSSDEEADTHSKEEEGLASVELSFGLEEPSNSPEKVTLEISPDAVDETDAPPAYNLDALPSYKPGNLRKSIRQTKAQSTGKVDFIRRVFVGLCCGTLCAGITIALNLAIPIAMIVMGALYLKSCQRQRYIPIYLLVGGCFGVAKAVILLVDQVRKSRRSRNNHGGVQTAPKPNPADGIITCFLGAWFIAGCYWIYSIHGDYQSVSPELDKYCHETLYLFAFWLTTTTFILMALGLFCCCAMCIGICIIGSKSS